MKACQLAALSRRPWPLEGYVKGAGRYQEALCVRCVEIKQQREERAEEQVQVE